MRGGWWMVGRVVGGWMVERWWEDEGWMVGVG